MEPRFGHDFSRVRIHADGQAQDSAQQLGAAAYTVGQHIVFGRARYASHAMSGRRLLAHELTHVVQQAHHPSRGNETVRTLSPAPEASLENNAHAVAGSVLAGRFPSASILPAPPGSLQRQSIPEAPGLGTSKTTAPVAETPQRPQAQMLEELTREGERLEQAKQLISWIDEHLFFTRTEMFADKALMDKLSPKPTTDADLQPLLELLAFHGILLSARDGPDEPLTADFDRVSAALNTQRIDQAAAEIPKFTKEFEKRIKAKDPAQPTVATAQVPRAWTPGVPSATRQKDVAAELRLQQIRKQLAAARAQGDQKKIDQLTKQEEQAEKQFRRASVNRSFAVPVVQFLERLRTGNTNWNVGTYVGHSWAEFSMDIYIKSGPTSTGFYKRDDARDFFDAVNKVAEESKPLGKFAWRGARLDVDVH